MEDINHMDALISIRGTVISDNAPPDVVEMVTSGRYCTKNGKRYIIYKESEATGLDGITTTLKIESGAVTLIRSGASQTRLLIAKGQRQLCHYGTDYGDLMVGISGCHINSKLDDVGGELSFDYTLDVNASMVSHNEVFISVREAKNHNDKSDQYGCQ